MPQALFVVFTRDRLWGWAGNLNSWRRHDMEMLSALLALLGGESSNHRWRPIARCQWCRALVFSLLLPRLSFWTNKQAAGEMRYFNALVMPSKWFGTPAADIALYGHSSTTWKLLYVPGWTSWVHICTYHQVSNISRTLVCNNIVDHSDVVGASPVGAAPTTSSFSN